jgi:hypothetical protein
MSKTESYFYLLPIALVYFFGNNFLLPEGLLYTAILSPVLLYYIYREGDFKTMLKWSLLLLIPVPFQLVSGVEVKPYLVSSLLLFTAWIFLFASIRAVKNNVNTLEPLFKTVLLINSLLILLALFMLPFQPLREVFWYSIPISPNIPGFPRLKLLAYEPSHYALLLSPVFFFYLVKTLTGKVNHVLLVLAAVLFPVLLSLSFGVIGAMVMALLIGTVAFAGKLPKIYWSFLFYTTIFMAGIVLIVWLSWPGNPVFMRIENILTGTDTSARGRLFNSFWFAWDLIKTHNLFMGVGPGQVKILAHDLIVNYYQYSGEYAEIVRIPNSMGETLAIYGIYGFVLKLFLELYFFIRFKLYNNYFNLVLFLFIFIYQFTGSFLINVAELGVWVIAFNARFPEFEIDSLKGSAT